MVNERLFIAGIWSCPQRLSRSTLLVNGNQLSLLGGPMLLGGVAFFRAVQEMAQNGIDPGLISATLAIKGVDHVLVKAG
jgi:hypothetical protein